jgi:hypothetical protein
VVIELKKGRPSDQVVGQVLRYMGWVKKHLCTNGQAVKGLVICRDHDPKSTGWCSQGRTDQPLEGSPHEFSTRSTVQPAEVPGWVDARGNGGAPWLAPQAGRGRAATRDNDAQAAQGWCSLSGSPVRGRSTPAE